MLKKYMDRGLEFLSKWPDALVNELKYVGSDLLMSDVAGVLEASCLPDAKHHIGKIRSIYFDTYGGSYWAEKRDGDNLKSKVRIRWYGDDSVDSGGEVNAYIEAKNRIGSARRKARAVIKVQSRWINGVALDDPSLPAFLYRHARKVSEPIEINLVPVVCISYSRLRYDCPQTGSRIALDYDIRADRVNPAAFPAVAGARLDYIVCEIKNTGKFIPSWCEMLYYAGLRLRSFSKFGECMNQILNGGIPV